MNNMENLKSEKGVTLVEVLAAITLLSIVLVSMLGMFPQMGMVNTHNEAKAQAINIAKEILIDWQEDSAVKLFIKETGHTVGFAQTPGDKVNYTDFSSTSFPEYYFFETTKDHYDVHIKIKKNSKIKVVSSEAQVNQIIVQLLNERGNIVSETYGYVRTGGEAVVPTTPATP
jgi:prepilin-type N-terminal cleavage/methylation domain-containing protein